MTEYPSDWESRRNEVFRRDGYECRNCGRTVGEDSELEPHAHHVVPLSEGGTNRVENLFTLCSGCHMAAHRLTKAPTYSAEENHRTLTEFKSSNDVQNYLARLYGEEYAAKILEKIEENDPISMERLKEAEMEAFQEVPSDYTEPAVRFESPRRKEKLRISRRISAKEKEHLR